MQKEKLEEGEKFFIDFWGKSKRNLWDFFVIKQFRCEKIERDGKKDI